MTVRADPRAMTSFTDDGLHAVRRTVERLGDARARLHSAMQGDPDGPAATLAGVLDDVEDLLGALAHLVAQPAVVGARFVRLDRSYAVDRASAWSIVAAVGTDAVADPELAVASLTSLRPDAVAAMWAGLSSADRQAAVAAHPDVLGHLAGIPTDVRDRCNRAILRHHIDGLRSARDHVRWDPTDLTGGAAWDPDPGRTAMDRRIRRLEGLLAVDRILAFDPTGDGRAVVAWGDPDRARHVATIVPGIGTTLAATPRLLREAAVLRDAARVVDERVATVAWLGYDTPHGVVAIGSGLATGDPRPLAAAATDTWADAQRAALVDHAAGLRATNPGVHHTVVGHSYGAVLTFRALTRTDDVTPLDVDDVVALGAPGPGAGVDDLDDLDLPRGVGVWSATAALDPVPLLPGVLGPAIHRLGDRVHHLPTDRGNRGHAAYFAPGSAAVRAMAVVVAGRTPRPATRPDQDRRRDSRAP